jgi:hypothetical protein
MTDLPEDGRNELPLCANQYRPLLFALALGGDMVPGRWRPSLLARDEAGSGLHQQLSLGHRIRGLVLRGVGLAQAPLWYLKRAESPKDQIGSRKMTVSAASLDPA